MNGIMPPRKLIEDIRLLVTDSQRQVASAINTAMVETYWGIGRRIVEEEQKGKAKAEYGMALIEELGKTLSREFGKGFSARNLRNMRAFYLAFPIWQTVSAKLSWSHYQSLIKIEDKKKRLWYAKETAHNAWSVRQLNRQMTSGCYERLLINHHEHAGKEEIVLAENTHPLNALHILKDPYILEFLDIKEPEHYQERELEAALIDQLQVFLLELGKGFSFVARQQRITTESGEHYYIDLVFYNYILKCFLLIELKTGTMSPRDVGQLDMYVRLYEKQYRLPGDNPPLGLLLCAQTDKTVMEYSIMAENKQLFASQYQLYLPTEQELSRILGNVEKIQ